MNWAAAFCLRPESSRGRGLHRNPAFAASAKYVDADQRGHRRDGAYWQDSSNAGRHMGQGASEGQVYLCPMHSNVRQANPGKCSKCGMDLVPEGTRFGLLRHMFSSPLHIAVMAAAMVAVMAAVMMMVH